MNNPGNVLLTDITYLQYEKTQTAYLSTILDAATNEVIAYQLRSHLKIDLVLETLEHLIFHSNIQLTKQTVIHSDQGSHYTSPKFPEKIKQLKIKQSISPKGNCWDNAPQESFFGYLKDGINLKEQMTLEELSKEIDDYIYYYNRYRHQWNLKKMIPVEYRNHLLTA
ncbi:MULTISPECIES: IS3 family transposase [Turicibacter]|uniref:IS3 family transposase n=1 Tax=Turicibacter TaxID=191303 RepID=UPI0009EB7CD4